MNERRAVLSSGPTRSFFLAHAQSAVGSGAGYVALVIVAYERLDSPWAIALVLLADFLPEMLLGAFLGALADRFSRRLLAAAGDIIRAVAFAGLVFVPGFEATLGFALLAGVGTALFQPALMAGLPGLVGERRLPAALGLFGAIDDLGWVAGPALAGALLAVSGPDALLAVNAITFALSALVLIRLPLDRGRADAAAPDPRAPSRRGMLVETLDGLRVAGQDGFVRTLIIASAASVLFMAMANVGELVLAVDALDAGETGFTLLAAAMCAGTALGSLAGGRPLSDSARCAGFVGGLLVAGIGYALAAGSPSLAAAIAAFVVIGLGNGLALVSERILLQQRVPERFKGRTFGVRGMLHSWAFVSAFLSAGGLITALGVRPLFLLVAAGTLTTCACAAVALRGPVRRRAAAPQLGTT